MVRIVSLATLAVIGLLTLALLPSAQSFNFGRIIINRPIVLRSPTNGPLEARQRAVSSPAVTGRARQLMSSMLRRLTVPASENGAGNGSTGPGSLGGAVLRAAERPRASEAPPTLPLPAVGLSSPARADDPAAPPPETSEQAPEQPADAPSSASAAPPPQVVSSPGVEPVRPVHPGGTTGGKGGGGKGGRGGGNKITGGDLGSGDDGSGE